MAGSNHWNMVIPDEGSQYHEGSTSMICHRHPQHLHCFADDAAQCGPLAQHYAGIHSIPLAAIVGSVGRCHELGCDFQPRHPAAGSLGEESRYRSIRRAVAQGACLPAIEVYQLGSHYYVLDGNHRVAAARSAGQLEIDAVVIAFERVASQVAAA
jgi:hypothetical protein